MGMSILGATVATPPPPVAQPNGLPPALPTQQLPTQSGSSGVKGWLFERLKGATVPAVTVGGGLAGGALGFVTLGPIGAAVGGLAGAFLGNRWIRS